MPGTPTTRLSLATIAGGTDNVSDYPAVFNTNQATLDNATIFLKGTFASLPAAGSTAAGTIYYATDTVQYFVCDGTAWQVWSLGQSGSSIIATSQSLTSTSYATLTTPDQVTGLVLPTSGLISVWYQATWQESVSNAARAAVFVGATQLKAANGSVNAAATQAAAMANGGATNIPTILGSFAGGLASGNTLSGYTGDVTTGQVIGAGTPASADYNGTEYALPTGGAAGGPCSIFAAAGTYTVSVKFKASSGSVTVANRRLYAKVIPF